MDSSMTYLKTAFALAGVVWLVTLWAGWAGIRLALRRTAESVRRARILALFAFVVGLVGATYFRVSYEETITSRATEGNDNSVVVTTHRRIDTKWFFAFSAVLGAISFVIVLR